MMSKSMKTRSVAASVLSGVLALSIVAPAFAQPQNYPPPPPQGGYPQNYPPQGPNGASPQGYTDPAMNPPPGYTAQDAQRDESQQMRDQDRAYAAQAEAWAQANCQRAEANRTTGGAILGGILGAVIGSNLASGGGRTGGAIIGGVGGAALGANVAKNSQGACPQGYAMRAGAPPYPAPVVVYDAPDWYNPWIWYDGRWMYRPYPYHRYYHEHYRR
jgi:hypothetical protein